MIDTTIAFTAACTRALMTERSAVSGTSVYAHRSTQPVSQSMLQWQAVGTPAAATRQYATDAIAKLRHANAAKPAAPPRGAPR